MKEMEKSNFRYDTFIVIIFTYNTHLYVFIALHKNNNCECNFTFQDIYYMFIIYYSMLPNTSLIGKNLLNDTTKNLINNTYRLTTNYAFIKNVKL